MKQVDCRRVKCEKKKKLFYKNWAFRVMEAMLYNL